jgi:hypothetical protein
MGALHRTCCFTQHGSTTTRLADVADRLHLSSTTTCDTVARDSTSPPDHTGLSLSTTVAATVSLLLFRYIWPH